MNVLVTLEQRFDRTPDGAVWTQVAFTYPFWLRYLEVFDGVRVAARIRDVDAPPPGHVRADGPQVSFATVPYYLGPWQYLRQATAVQQAVRQALSPADAVIMRVGSQVANCLFPTLRAQRRPYGVEVVGDPWDVFAPGTIRHPLRPLLRRYFSRQLRTQCSHATAAAYVTEHALQARYPVGARQPSFSYSSVDLPRNAIRTLSVGVSDVELSNSGFLDGPRDILPDGPFRLVFVGSLAQLYKGPDVLLEALQRVLHSGLNAQLTIIGDGCYRARLVRQAERLGIAHAVEFRGQLAKGTAVRSELDQANLFVLPSRTEGLPRALIEAMARALPCVASRVGGIPELLPPEDLVPPGDAQALAQKIVEILNDPERRYGMASRNLARARDFRADVLRERRLGFFRFVREQTESWLGRRRAA